VIRKQLLIEGCTVACYEGGSPGKLPLLLMHGLGPGAAIASAFATILPFLSSHFHLFATDLIGFGNSGRKPAMPYFDFPLWVRQARSVLNEMPAGPIGVFGHSASGAIALQLAASEPRVAAVITTGTVGTRLEVNEHLARLWTYPRTRDELRSAMRSLVYDAERVPDDVLDARWATLQTEGYREYFDAMFSGSLQKLADTWVIPDALLRRITADITFVHGRDDLPCPAQSTSVPLAERIRHANLVLLSNCGHAPAAERPNEVCAALRLAFARHIDF
jgi:2-hydroxymuconate-semialdehyde hydrolase